MALFSGGLLLQFIISCTDDVLTALPSASGSSRACFAESMASLLRCYSAPPGCDSDWYEVIESLLHDLQTMAVGIASEKSFGEAEISLGNLGDAGRNGASASAIKFSECLFGIDSPEHRLPMPDIIGARVLRRRPAIAR